MAKCQTCGQDIPLSEREKESIEKVQKLLKRAIKMKRVKIKRKGGSDADG